MEHRLVLIPEKSKRLAKKKIRLLKLINTPLQLWLHRPIQILTFTFNLRVIMSPGTVREMDRANWNIEKLTSDCGNNTYLLAQ